MKVNIYIYVYDMTNELGLFQERSIEAGTWNGIGFSVGFKRFVVNDLFGSCT